MGGDGARRYQCSTPTQPDYSQLDSFPKPVQIARLSKMVQQLEMILSKKKTGRKNSESASIELESQTGASGVPSAGSGAHSAVSELSCARNIPGASASAAAFPRIPTARPDSDSEFTDPYSSGKRTAVQAGFADRGEIFFCGSNPFLLIFVLIYMNATVDNPSMLAGLPNPDIKKRKKTNKKI
jgi:hypothetical protein